MKLSKYIVLGALLGSCITANATLYQFSYTFNGGDVSVGGVFDGTAIGDIININDFQSLSFTSPLVSLTTKGEVGFGPIWPPITAYTSFSGASQNFFVEYSTIKGIISFDLTALAGENVPTQLMRFVNDGWTTPQVNADDVPPNKTWKVAALVPEPATYGMLLAGLGILGFVARRRKQF